MDKLTNHLDIESIEGLIKGINEYNGGILVIHDIYLIKSIEKSCIYELENKNIKLFNDDFDKYINKVFKN